MKQYQNPTEQSRSTWIVFLFVILMVLPSIFILMGVMEEVNRDRNVKNFVTTYIESKNRHVDYECEPYIDDDDNVTDSMVLRVWILLGDTINDNSVNTLKTKLAEYNLKKTGLQINQSPKENIDRLIKQSNDQFTQEKNIYQTMVKERDQKIDNLYKYIDSLASPYSILNKIELLYPELESKEYGIMTVMTDSSQLNLPTLTLKWNRRTSAKFQQKANKKIGDFMQQKLQLDTIQVK